jgi:DnaJ family protein C protein 9
VWDEFYGSGEKGGRKTNGKANGKGKENEVGGDGADGLAAMIVKRQREREGGLNALEEKYRRIEEEEREKKRAKGKKGNAVVEENGAAPV